MAMKRAAGQQPRRRQLPEKLCVAFLRDDVAVVEDLESAVELWDGGNFGAGPLSRSVPYVVRHELERARLEKAAERRKAAGERPEPAAKRARAASAADKEVVVVPTLPRPATEWSAESVSARGSMADGAAMLTPRRAADLARDPQGLRVYGYVADGPSLVVPSTAPHLSLLERRQASLIASMSSTALEMRRGVPVGVGGLPVTATLPFSILGSALPPAAAPAARDEEEDAELIVVEPRDEERAEERAEERGDARGEERVEERADAPGELVRLTREEASGYRLGVDAPLYRFSRPRCAEEAGSVVAPVTLQYRGKVEDAWRYAHEALALLPEEALFLSQPATGARLVVCRDAASAGRVLRGARGGATRAELEAAGALRQEELWEHYARRVPNLVTQFLVFRWFRRMGWVAKASTVFGTHLALYRHGPEEDHSAATLSYAPPSAEVQRALEGCGLPAAEAMARAWRDAFGARFAAPTAPASCWTALQSCQRVASLVGKSFAVYAVAPLQAAPAADSAPLDIGEHLAHMFRVVGTQVRRFRPDLQGERARVQRFKGVIDIGGAAVAVRQRRSLALGLRRDEAAFQLDAAAANARENAPDAEPAGRWLVSDWARAAAPRPVLVTTASDLFDRERWRQDMLPPQPTTPPRSLEPASRWLEPASRWVSE